MGVNEPTPSVTGCEMKDYLNVVDGAPREATVAKVALQHLNSLATPGQVFEFAAR
jgi:hypothetical protein